MDVDCVASVSVFHSFSRFSVSLGRLSLLLLIDGRYAAGIFLAIYGVAIVSTSDNLVRSYVIGNQAQIHPLIALVAVIGHFNSSGFGAYSLDR